MIVNAFAEGDRRTLKNLLSREVYDGFETAITEREKRGETVESRFVSIDKADDHRRRIARPHRAGHRALPVQAGSVTRDKDGNVIDGNADKVTDVTDVWTFARDAVVARSELETGRHRSRAMTAWLAVRTLASQIGVTALAAALHRGWRAGAGAV